MRAVLRSMVLFCRVILFTIVAGGCNASVTEWASGATPSHDARAAEADASSVLDGSSDVGRPVPRAIVLGWETCDDEMLSLPPDFVRPGETLWHLCYATPTTDTSSSRLARQVSEAVTFTERSSWTGEATPLIRIQPDIADIGWVASAVVALPDAPRAYPLFNARNIYDSERDGEKMLVPLWAVDVDRTGRALETHGVLSAWRVSPSGRREQTSLRAIVNSCVDDLSPDILHGASFLPEGETCPGEYSLCAPGRYHCDDEP